MLVILFLPIYPFIPPFNTNISNNRLSSYRYSVWSADTKKDEKKQFCCSKGSGDIAFQIKDVLYILLSPIVITILTKDLSTVWSLNKLHARKWDLFLQNEHIGSIFFRNKCLSTCLVYFCSIKVVFAFSMTGDFCGKPTWLQWPNST